MGVTLRLSDGQIVKVADTGGIVGRDPHSEVWFKNATGIAPQHARLERVGGNWFLQALSGESFQVNGKTCKTTKLTPGTVVRFTESGIGFEFEPANVQPLKNATAVGSAGFSKPLVAGLGGTLLVLTLGLGAWAIWPQGGMPPEADKSLEKSDPQEVRVTPVPPDPQPPVAVARAAAPFDPQDHLVLFGYQALDQPQIPPTVITVGWLLDSETVVVSALVAKGFVKLLQDAELQNKPLQLCAIQGTPIPVATWQFPAGCPEVALLKLSEPAFLEGDLAEHFASQGAKQAALMQERGDELRLCSYEELPRSPKVQQPLVSLVSYTTGLAKPGTQAAELNLEIESRVLGRLVETRPAEGEKPLEPGGLLLNNQDSILGICLVDRTIVWSDELREGLGLTAGEKTP